MLDRLFQLSMDACDRLGLTVDEAGFAVALSAAALAVIGSALVGRRSRRRQAAARLAALHREREAARARRMSYVRDNPLVDCPECGTRARHRVMARAGECTAGKLYKGTNPVRSCRREFRGRPHVHFECYACLSQFALQANFVDAEIAAELARGQVAVGAGGAP